MTEKQEDEELIDFLNSISSTPPSQFFERDASPDTTTVRTQNFALKSIVAQLATPINLEAESTCRWLIYKQSGPQRHQKFFGFLRQMARNVSKFNEMSLVKRLNSVLKKAENAGNFVYRIEPVALKFLGSEWLKRLFLLEKIAETARKCAENALGMLEIGQWINLSLVIFAVSAQIYSEVLQQCLEMERTWCPSISAIFRDIDAKFPQKLADLEVVKRLKISAENRKNLAGNSEIMRLLKFSNERIQEAHVENELRQKASEILHNALTTEMTESLKSKGPSTSSSAQFDMSDLGISISREDASFLNSTIQSTSTTFLLKSDDDDDNLLMSPNLFAPKSLKTVKKLTKRKSEVSESTTPKKIQKTSSFLTSTLDLLSEGKKKKKKSKK